MKNAKRILKNEKGMATIEVIPLLLVFVYMLCFEFGMFGIIHTGIMQSMAARTYAFETFRNRTNLTYFRDNNANFFVHFRNTGTRTHGIASELATDEDKQTEGIASERPLRVGIPLQPDESSRKNLALHNEKVFDQALVGPQKRNQVVGVSPVWIQIEYGMCLNTRCGG